MPKKVTFTLSGLILLALGFLFGPEAVQGIGGTGSSTSATSTRSESPSSAGDSTASVGDSTASAGYSAAPARDSTAPAGYSAAPAGYSAASAGDSTASAGDSTASARDSTASAGDSTASARDSKAPASSTATVDTRVGFTSQRALDEHYAKHGHEFGSITEVQYLRRAQELRDARAGGDVREAVRSDGVITRFDTRSGAFIAFHQDKSIRTFFQPNDGLRYFERQLDKEH